MQTLVTYNFFLGLIVVIRTVALVCTIFYHTWLYSTFSPLFTYLPVTTEGDARQKDREYELERLRVPVEGQRIEKNVDDAPLAPASAPLSDDAPQQWHTKFGTSEKIPEQGRLGEDSNKESEESVRERDFTPRCTGRTATSSTGGLSSPRTSGMVAQQRRDGQSAKRILARLNKPLDEARLLDLEHHLGHVEHNIGNALAPRQADVERQMMNDPISKIIMQHNDELEDLDAEERDLLVSVAFTHPVLRSPRPSVWIPEDELGVSEDEIRRTRKLSRDVVIENRGAYFNRKLRVEVNRQPPDLSEYSLIMAEL